MPTISVFQPTRILSATNASDLVTWVNHAIDSGNRALLIDLGQVLFMDSSGLGALVTVLKMVQRVQGRLGLCRLNGQARMLFEMAAMDQVFEIFENPEAFRQDVQEITPVN